jgi:hypothetical protein
MIFYGVDDSDDHGRVIGFFAIAPHLLGRDDARGF